MAQHADDAFALLAKLVRADSTVGHEQAAEEVLAGALQQLGFTIERLPIPADIGSDPLAGVPQQSYAGRYNLVARRSGSDPNAPSLLLNGHIDVVPVEDASGWTSPPFAKAPQSHLQRPRQRSPFSLPPRVPSRWPPPPHLGPPS